MGIEIERRFLVLVDKLPDLSECHSEIIDQAYFSSDPWVRVRVYRGNRPRALLTIKGQGTLKRPEVNCEIPAEKAQEMWPLAKSEIHKIRHNYESWEIDEFTGALAGLWLVEIELEAEDSGFDKPEWLGQEVTEDIRYSNAYLAEHGRP
jgi:adenylate cyclase